MKQSTITAEFKSDIKRVWNVVTDNTRSNWRSDLSNITIVDENNFVETTNDDIKTNFNITKKEPFHRYEFSMSNDKMAGTWVGTFEETISGTKIVFTEYVTPKSTVMNIFLKVYLKKQQNTYIEDLKKALRE